MEARKLNISELRELVKAVSGVKETLPYSLLPLGFTKGSVVEVVGSGKTEFIIKFLAENKALRVAWIEPELTIFPYSFLQNSVELSRILFVVTNTDILWATLQIIQAQIFEVVVLSFVNLDDKLLRKVQLAAEKAQVLVVLLSEQPLASWVLSQKILVARSQNEKLSVETLQKRG